MAIIPCAGWKQWQKAGETPAGAKSGAGNVLVKRLQKQQVPDTQWLTETPPTSPAAKNANYAFFANSGSRATRGN